MDPKTIYWMDGDGVIFAPPNEYDGLICATAYMCLVI